MHGAFLVYFSISIEILAITAVLHFLVKATKEGMGGLMKWLAYILLIVGFLILICTTTNGLMMMMHHEKDGQANCGGRCGYGMMDRGHCMGGQCDGKCDGQCGGMMKHDCMMEHGGMMKDGKGCCMDSMKKAHGMMNENDGNKMMKDSVSK